jgi:hypothetical protein
MATQPNKISSLAAFARALGINPATARQWKRRGRIVERDGSYSVTARDTFTDSVTRRDSVTVERDADGVTGRDGVTNYCRECHAVTVERDELRTHVAALVTERDSMASEVDRLRSEVLRLERAAIGAALSQFDDQTPLTPDEIATLDAEIDLNPDWGA